MEHQIGQLSLIHASRTTPGSFLQLPQVEEPLFLSVSVGLYTCQYRGLDVSLQSQKLPFGSIHVMHVSH